MNDNRSIKMAKIVIDPGHGGNDSGATYKGRREKDDVLRLGLEVGKLLQRNGEDVYYTRVSDTYNTPLEKAEMGNKVNADFFLSLHRNSTNTANSANGAGATVYEISGLREEMANELLKGLEKIGYPNRGILSRPDATILRRTEMPTVVLDVGFIDNEGDNAIFDEKFYQLAREIALAILTVLREKEPSKEKDNLENLKNSNSIENEITQDVPPKLEEGQRQPLYRVQVGAFRNYQNAARFLNQLQNEGYPAFILLENNIYRIQVGAYELLDNAIRMEQQLRSRGYNTFIATNG
jgi:N-acetylmuramoyl-L-alanine amidase